jgi:hypothetical protein
MPELQTAERAALAPTVTGREERGRAGQGPRALARKQPRRKQRRQNSSRAHQTLPKLSTAEFRYTPGSWRPPVRRPRH